jgi:hypothetical protein
MAEFNGRRAGELARQLVFSRAKVPDDALEQWQKHRRLISELAIFQHVVEEAVIEVFQIKGEVTLDQRFMEGVTKRVTQLIVSLSSIAAGGYQIAAAEEADARNIDRSVALDDLLRHVGEGLEELGDFF